MKLESDQLHSRDTGSVTLTSGISLISGMGSQEEA